MSAGAVRGFLPTLRELERQLTIPIPERLRILWELEYDLEELRSRLEAEGVSGTEARARALEVLAPDVATLRELHGLHSSAYHRLTGRVGVDLLRVVERSALAFTAAFVLVTETLFLLRADLLGDPSPFVWPVLGLGALLFTAIAAKFFQLWVKADHTTPDRGLGVIVGLSGAISASAVGGVFADTLRLAAALERAPDLAGALALRWLAQDAALAAIAILLAMTGGLAWFVISQWLAVVSAARREILGLDLPTTIQQAR